MGTTLNIYFAGRRVGHLALMGNAMLAEAISDLSDRRFCCVLPQNFPVSQKCAKSVCDENLQTLLECDLALFVCEQPELDAQSMMEFATAKFADMPCVVLQTAAQSEDWKPLVSFFPRTEIEALDAAAIYEGLFTEFPMTDAEDVLIEERSSEVARTMVRVIAQAVVDAFDRVLEQSSTMDPEDASAIFHWLGTFSSPTANIEQGQRAMQAAMTRKRGNGMLEPAPAPRTTKAS